MQVLIYHGIYLMEVTPKTRVANAKIALENQADFKRTTTRNPLKTL